jgi:iron complex outermembrane receptor protein
MFAPFALALALCCTAHCATELTEPIPRQPLMDALEGFAKTSGYQLVYRADLVVGSTSPGAAAHLPLPETLGQLLRGTGLTFEFVNDHTIAIVEVSAGTEHGRPDLRAQKPDGPDRATAGPSIKEILVTGTRQGSLHASDSPVPVQVITRDELQSVAAASDLMSTLAQLIPSMTMQAYGLDLAAQTLQSKLRGLSPNHVLVLIDGKRRHTTANIAVAPGSAYQGGAAVALDFIPIDAIDHIEVLTDGAAAQYGTDAIAGVINIITRRNYQGGSIAGMGGSYGQGGGASGDVSGNLGFMPTSAGYLDVTGEVHYQGHSNQGAIDERVINPLNLASYPDSNMPLVAGYPHLNGVEGDAKIHTALVALEAGWPLEDGTELYTFDTYGEKQAASYENYRLPTKLHYTDPQTGITSYPFPFGFEPQEATHEQDFSGTAGAKGTWSAWHWDLGTVYGRDHIDLYTLDSANAGIYNATGSTTPSHYYDGLLQTTQWTTTLDVNRDFDAGLATPLNTAFGAEYRRESYNVGAGIPPSYQLGGAQAYPGFSTADASAHARQNMAAYADLAGKPVERVRMDAAVRLEHYSDFGHARVFKLAGRWDVAPSFALRGTVSDGFRAPTLAEEFYSSTTVTPTTAFVQLPPNSPAGRRLGLGNGLKPEESTHLTLGFVFTPSANLSVNFDVYQISIRNRIVDSGQLVGSSASKVIAPNVLGAIAVNGNQLDPDVIATGITGINVFTNGIDMRTRGGDFTLALPTDLGAVHITYSIGATYNATDITRIRATPAQLGSTPLFDAEAISDLTTANPKYIIDLGALGQFGAVTLNLIEKIYGPSAEYENDDGDNPTGMLQYFRTNLGVIPVTNLDLSYQFSRRVKASIGAKNLFNRFPPTLNPTLLEHVNSFAFGDDLGVQRYPSFSPFGINGGYYFAKVSAQF